ncbi:MAG: hypothetical protein EP335_17760 [Alphaproteobacteria bacterium]|nr:MAG: hypothetical protein EP335_17760 [Alphaproteobacteria bacterium]
MPHYGVQKLISLVDALLAGRLTYDTFLKDFHWFYFAQVPDAALSAPQRDFFSEVAEKTGFVGLAIDEKSRSCGWISPLEFLLWLKGFRREYGGAFMQDLA